MSNKKKGNRKVNKGKNSQERLSELLETLEHGVTNFKYEPDVYKAVLEMKG